MNKHIKNETQNGELMVNFYMLIGLPGAGKSEIAKQLAQLYNADIVSSDDIRNEFYGEESIQGDNAKIFDEMRRRTLTSLKNGKNVVYDATNISRKKRSHLIRSITIDCHKTAYVVWAKYETCLLRDRLRNRNVGESVIKEMLTRFQPPYYDEGWDEIKFHINDAPYTNEDYEQWIDCPHDNPHHNNTVKEHTLRVMTETAKLQKARMQTRGSSIILLITASLHDIGKKFVKAFKNCRGKPSEIAHFYDHQNVGSYFAIGYEETLGLHTKQRALIYWLINVHMDPFLKTKYSAALPEKLSKLLEAFHLCDVTGA